MEHTGSRSPAGPRMAVRMPNGRRAGGETFLLRLLGGFAGDVALIVRRVGVRWCTWGRWADGDAAAMDLPTARSAGALERARAASVSLMQTIPPSRSHKPTGRVARGCRAARGRRLAGVNRLIAWAGRELSHRIVQRVDDDLRKRIFLPDRPAPGSPAP